MKKVLKTFFQYGFFLSLGLGLVWWQLRVMTETEVTEFKTAIKNADYSLLIPIILMALSSHVIRAVRWKMLIEPLGYKPRTSNTFLVVMIGYLANSAVPRLGEILKCSLLSKYEKIPTSPLIGTVVIERIIDLLTFGLLIFITLVFQADIIGGELNNQLAIITQKNTIPIWAKGLIGIALILMITFSIRYLFKKYPNNKIIQKIKNISKELIQGVLTVKKIKNRSLFLLLTLAMWLLYLGQIYVGFQAIEATNHLSILAACSLLSIGTVAMIATPGGIGTFPLGIEKVIVAYGVSAVIGKSFGWIIWGISTAIIIITGVLSIVIIPYINKNKTNENA
jgi:uncharacterized protein (TIRG00374 family)